MEKIKILHVLTDTNIGGAGTLLLNYLRCFNRDKYDIRVCLPGGAALIPLVRKEGYEVIELEHGRDKSLEISAISEFVRLFGREKPDIVHTHSAFSAKLAAYLSGVKSRIYTRHSVFKMPKKLTSFPGKQINGFINNTLATKIVAVAEAAKDNLTETGINPEKIVVIINGAFPIRRISDDEKSTLRKSLGISDSTFVLGIPARLEYYKGHSFLLESIKEISEKYEDIKLLIMGDGTEKQNLTEKAERLGVADKVIFTGFIKDLVPYYNIMNLGLNCSYGAEASSVALAEGMSLGVPAAVTNAGGNPGMITDGVNGLIVPEADPHAMAEAIMKIISDKALYERLSAGALSEYGKKYTAEVMTRRIEALYDREINRIKKKTRG